MGMTREQEREFLIKLAPVWLACRWKIMGHALHGWPFRSELEYDLLGCLDYGAEMGIILREISSAHMREISVRTIPRM
jgi:hypothetical protein